MPLNKMLIGTNRPLIPEDRPIHWDRGQRGYSVASPPGSRLAVLEEKKVEYPGHPFGIITSLVNVPAEIMCRNTHRIANPGQNDTHPPYGFFSLLGGDGHDIF
jgi:hypothetical protein